MNLGPYENNGPNPKTFLMLVEGVGTWAPVTSSILHWPNPRTACLDVPGLMSLQFNIVHVNEVEHSTIMASCSPYT